VDSVIASLKMGLLSVGFILLAIVGLPFFAAIAVVLLPLLMAALLLAGLGSLVLSGFSPHFREWLDAKA